MYNLFIMRRFVYIANWFVYFGKNHWFTAFLGSKIHTQLVIVTANELGLAFPPRNLPKKFRTDPCTFYLVIVVTDRQTYAGDSIIPRESFRGDNSHPLSWWDMIGCNSLHREYGCLHNTLHETFSLFHVYLFQQDQTSKII